jgi:hypothetical protein
MPLTEEAFAALTAAGCPGCRGKRLAIEAYVLQSLPLLAGELFGAPSWAYKGEDFVHGAYRIACDGCKKELHVETACAKCAAPDGVARALESENGFPFPSQCASCAGELMTATAYVPVVVMYDGKPAKARGQTAPEDPGFHAIRVECKNCRKAVEPEAGSGCPLCAG